MFECIRRDINIPFLVPTKSTSRTTAPAASGTQEATKLIKDSGFGSCFPGFLIRLLEVPAPGFRFAVSVPDHANRGVVDQDTRKGLTPRLIDLLPIDYAHRR
jgi:hypothetical protein